ncbi:MAG: hypothetical protein PUB51_03360, partial [Oscillospiraceae bacterium]|nr:hypothetical protein [Oscillospiraceae bacterium]
MTTEERTAYYAKGLQGLIRCETVSVRGQVDLPKFRAFHDLLRQTFPNLFARLEVEEFDGSLLMRWPGRASDAPIMLM